MRKLFGRIAVASALAAFAVPALPCDAAKHTTASAQEKSQDKPQKKEAKAEKKGEKKAASSTVASADKK